MLLKENTSPCSTFSDAHYYSAWSIISVGVEDLDAALHLWVDLLGFNILSSKDGEDEGLATLWGLEPSDIARQAIVRTNDSQAGMIHFVQFNNPDSAVREGADNFDLLPKALDVYVENLPEKVELLRQEGVTFQTAQHSEISAPSGTNFRQIKVSAHDVINISMIEVVGKHLPYNQKGYAGIGPFAYTTADSSAENEFFNKVFLVDRLNENVLEGPEIEKAIGLPKGTSLYTNIWGRKGHDLGEIEIVEYRGVQGKNFFPRAKPKSLGVLHIGYLVPDASAIKQRLDQQGVSYQLHKNIKTEVGSGDVITFHSPAGLKIEVYQV